jgi:hypothetical protein
MPKLLLFAPCEKVLVDRTSNLVTLISLLQELHYKLPPGMPTPSNFALPLSWAVLSLWQEEPSDGGIQFEQKFVLENAAGVALMENIAPWQFTAANHRIIANVMGLPVSRRLSLHLFYRITGALDWIRAATYPIEMVQDAL